MPKIKVLRALFNEGKRVEPGSVIDLSPMAASDAVNARRAEYFSDEDRDGTYAGIRAKDESDFKKYANARDSFWSRTAKQRGIL